MLDIIKEGLKLNQSLALLPLKAARRLVDDKNTGARQMIDIAEDMVSTPFVAAVKAIDGSARPCAGQNNAGQTCPRGQGPTVRNIWVDPKVTVFSDIEVRPGERRTILSVTGLLCGG